MNGPTLLLLMLVGLLIGFFLFVYFLMYFVIIFSAVFPSIIAPLMLLVGLFAILSVRPENSYSLRDNDLRNRLHSNS